MPVRAVELFLYAPIIAVDYRGKIWSNEFCGTCDYQVTAGHNEKDNSLQEKTRQTPPEMYPCG